MRRQLSFSLLIACLAVTRVPALAQAPRDDVKILEELKALRERVEALEKVILELKAKLDEPRETDDVALPIPRGGENRSADRKRLSKIKLPETPTREDVEAYVDDIIEASRFQNTFSEQDPQVTMLAKVGKQHADVLVEKYDSGCHFYFDAALKRSIGPEHKELLIEALGPFPGLVEVVVAKGWARDARQMLIDGLSGRPHYLPTEWIEAVAVFKDPATYEDLVFYFVHGMNQSFTYDAIRKLPGLELDAAVAEAWMLRQAGVSGIPRSLMREDGLVPIAFAHGHESSIDPTFLCLKQTEEWNRKRARDAILAHTEATGSDEEILAWYEARKGRLKWDKEQRKFLAGAK